MSVKPNLDAWVSDIPTWIGCISDERMHRIWKELAPIIYQKQNGINKGIKDAMLRAGWMQDEIYSNGIRATFWVPPGYYEDQ